MQIQKFADAAKNDAFFDLAKSEGREVSFEMSDGVVFVQIQSDTSERRWIVARKEIETVGNFQIQ